MAKTLGLDLGTNSIGWALIENKEEKILAMGSRIFPIGVDNVGEGEKELSKNSRRTAARGIRRQYFRKKLSKNLLLKILSAHNMCPISHGDVIEIIKGKVSLNCNLKTWFELPPYELRNKAIKEEISLIELGRIFYHMMQRRGFLSNSRKNKSDDGAIFKGKASEGKIGINQTLNEIQDKTLGEYLYSILPVNNQPFQDGKERVRNRYTTRQMYFDEFDAIWDKQKQFHETLTNELRIKLGGRKQNGDPDDGVLFYQRPLRSQKHLIGNCSFEPTKHKCPISAIPFEIFRIYQWVNTVECNGNKLFKDDRELLVQFLLRNDKPNFKRLRKVINKEDAHLKFNYKDDDKIIGAYTISKLSSKKFFGEKWFELDNKSQEDIWHVLHFFDSKSKLKKYAQEKWGFNEKQADDIASFNLKDGYSNLSRKAINNILPFLEMGFTYDIAVVFGGIKNAFQDKWNSLSIDEKQLIYNTVPDIVKTKAKGGFIQNIKEFLQQEFNLEEIRLSRLYHHSASITANKLLDKLPTDKNADLQIQSIRNPIVITALFELRKLINAIIDEYGSIDEIKVEMARELKQSKIQRNKTRIEQRRLENENDRIKSEVEKYTRVTHESILKYKLWEECKQTCPYTGKTIPINELFSGRWQIEHIHPWSRSLNDSFMNKTLCDADENRRKGDKTPFEFYGDDTQNWVTIKERALKLFSDTKQHPKAYQKFKRFVQQKFDDDFTSRQLNDTRYISKEAKNYLSMICPKVSVSPGQLTAKLRHMWGLNSLLNDENEKSREDHRHHSIDALVVACTKQSYLQELSKWNRYDRNYELEGFTEPWANFYKDAEKNVNQILVSHKRENKVLTIRNFTTIKGKKSFKNLGVAARGQLHKENVYGKRQTLLLEEAYHIRKSIDSLSTEKQINKIVDPAIRNLIFKRVEELGGFDKDKIPPNTFFESLESGERKPKIFLPNKNGEPVPILKVRIKENIGSAVQLKEKTNQWVNPRNNHHVLIYKNENDEMCEEVVTYWTVVERKRNGMPVYQLPSNGKEIITTLHINDLFILGLNDDDINWDEVNFHQIQRNLFRVQKLSSKFYEFRLVSEASLKNTFAPYYHRIQSFGEGKTGWMTFNPIKVSIDVLGKIYR